MPGQTALGASHPHDGVIARGRGAHRTTAAETHARFFRSYGNIMFALVMHDIKNRFFGSGLGQIVMILWPFVHIVVLLLVYGFSHRPHPYGTSTLQYSAISVFPFICFNYVTRWVVISAITNRTFLQYPIIKPLDIIIARMLLEVISMTIVGALLVLVVVACGDEAMPANPMEAVCAIGATLFLAVAFGVPNAVIAFILPMWNIVIAIVIVCSYISSGILFVTSELPEQIRVPLSYNPLLQCTEWLRVAYYSDYPTTVLDKTYVLVFALVSLTLGLLMEKVLRRYF
ncbi:putative polysaccharide ABC exporter, permease protein [Beijerinckiaceae bacterium RH AL1]|nr:ABC transporter permease [Beijerinckiaceae bacterium]VVB42782.1 putative polysaccharide ABC exporter, permease protein [Beijerinckiaceae bacterium RH AL8]VVB42793.1 putative polysaccharide ABC exporter, permease protein [Beijerinckiaceae bacterium RH CH11]VVC53500.1 putative polysaccharide ABC exporter, permease protein [Beijerinckiaceae bacterium RH AL1]